MSNNVVNNGPTEIGRLACIGVGAMGEALIAGFLRAGLLSAADVFVADADEGRARLVADKHGVTAGANADVSAQADIVIIAVKPQFVPPVLQQIAAKLHSDALVISIAAGVPLSVLEQHLPAGTAAVRAMPNTPALVGHGATALAAGLHVNREQLDAASRLFAAVGTASVVAETMLDAVTGLSGSGPAYVYLFIEALADGGVQAGLPRDVALQLAAQTVLGAAHMVQQTGMHPGALKDMVTSPAGTTIAGVATLEDHGLRAACLRAVEAAANRSRQLGQAREQGERAR